MFEQIITLIGSGGLIAIITALLTKATTEKNYQLQHIVEERKKWRESIRTEMQKVSADLNVENLIALKTFLFLRINPTTAKNNKDKEIIYTLDQLIQIAKNDVNSETVTKKWNILLEQVSKLLKHDWERSKEEVKASSIFVYITATILYLLIIVLPSIKTLEAASNLAVIEIVSKGLKMFFFYILVMFLSKYIAAYIHKYKLEKTRK